MFGLGGLDADPEKWVSARGHVSAIDGSGATTDLIRSSGSGCFTVAGFATPTNRDPVGLVVDLRDVKKPFVLDRRNSELATYCL